MAPPDDKNITPPRTADVPATTRNFTTVELEAVIRRAVELQSGNSARSEDGISEVDVVRIGQELGIDAATVRRAMAEVRVRPPEEEGALRRIAGPGAVRASRVIRCPAASMISQLDGYLRTAELMVPQRRFPDRTRYVRDASIAAGLTRFARNFDRPHPPLKLSQLDVAVSPLDGDSCLVELSADLTNTRAGLVGGMLGGGGGAAAAWAVTVWATTIVDPLMLLGIPVFAGSWFGMRAIYRSITTSVEERMESLLDRIEHNELMQS